MNFVLQMMKLVLQMMILNANDQVARLHIKSKGKVGWVSYNDDGSFGKRHFTLVSTAKKKGMQSGCITGSIITTKDAVNVTIKAAEKMKPVETTGFRAGICAMVRVNGYQQRTPTVHLPDTFDPEVLWNDGNGHTMSFKKRDEDDDGHIDDIESIIIKLFGVPYMTAEDTSDLVGIFSVPLDLFMDKEEWEIVAIGADQWVVREELVVRI